MYKIKLQRLFIWNLQEMGEVIKGGGLNSIMIASFTFVFNCTTVSCVSY